MTLDWQKIRADLVDFITYMIQPQRLRNDYQLVLRDRIRIFTEVAKVFTRSHSKLFPVLGDLVRIPEVKGILEPAEKMTLTIESFKTLEPQLPAILARWTVKSQEDMDKFFRKEISDIPSSVAPKDLVLAHMLRCLRCFAIIPASHPVPTIHHCQRPIWGRRRTGVSGAYELALHDLGIDPSTMSEYRLLQKYTMKVLEACGRNRLTTIHELDALNPRLTCEMCYKEPGIRTIYTWRDAVSRMCSYMIIDNQLYSV